MGVLKLKLALVKDDMVGHLEHYVIHFMYAFVSIYNQHFILGWEGVYDFVLG